MFSMETDNYEIPEEKLKEWEEFLVNQTMGGMNYAMVAGGAALSLLQAYRKQREEIERLRKDSKRLDFIDRSGVDWDGFGGFFFKKGSHSGDDLRECVDKAMKEDQEEEECNEK